MTDETNQPAAPVDPTAEGQPATSMTFNDALESLETLRVDNGRLTKENAELRKALDKATGVHEPEPFPCALYRGSETTQVNGPSELSSMLAHGWREKPK